MWRVIAAVSLAGLLGACDYSESIDPYELPPVLVVDAQTLRAELTTDAAIARLTERSLRAYEHMVTALESAGSDCERAARALRPIVLRDAWAIARAKALSSTPDLLARARPILEQNAERTRRLGHRLDAASEYCAQDARVVELMTYF